MRTLLATLLLLTMLLPAPALAQDGTQAPLAEDPKGDTTLTPLGLPTQPGPGADDVDLTGLWLWEDPGAFHVQLRLAHMDGEPGPDQPATYTYFTFDGTDFRVYQGRSSDNEAWFSSLSTRTGTGTFRYAAPLRSFYDVGAGLVWTDLPRDLLAGSSGALPGRGDSLTNVWASSFAVLGHSTTFNQPPLPAGALYELGDRVPDADGLAVEVQFGGATGSGGLVLRTPTPYRASNGGDAVYVFDLEADNAGQAARELTLEAMHMPDGWNLTLPGDHVRLDAGTSVQFQAVLRTPFFHQHGTSKAFHLRLADPADGNAWATLELGVHYLAVPQPAGHHDTVFLHTHPWAETAHYVNAPLGGTDGVLTFNTLEEDPEDSGQPLLAYSTSPVFGNVGDVYGWAGCLDPALALGLDLDEARTGTLSIPVKSGKPLLAATLQGRILYVPPAEGMTYCFPSEYYDLDVVELATIEPTEAAALDANQVHVFETSITPVADRQAFEPGGHLVLELFVSGGTVATGGLAGLELQPGGYAILPLREYNDTVPMAALTGGEGSGEAAVFSAPSAPAQGAPAPGLAVVAAALVALALLRRQK